MSASRPAAQEERYGEHEDNRGTTRAHGGFPGMLFCASRPRRKFYSRIELDEKPAILFYFKRLIGYGGSRRRKRSSGMPQCKKAGLKAPPKPT
jgi:hypothetical protein